MPTTMPSSRADAVRPLLALLLSVVLSGVAGCAPGWAGPSEQPSTAAEAARSEFGVAIDPWSLPDWTDAVGARPTMVMEFEQWYRSRTLDNRFAESRRQGMESFMVTWEPWIPVPAELGPEARHEEQPGFSNAAIAAGERDHYIRAFAESVAASGLTVYIRHAHEMNGDWYPWSRDPEAFVRAWRHIVDIFRDVGATNARFVFSPNPSLYQGPEEWREKAEPYWPGADYVDLLGPTMISFGGEKDYSVADFAERLELMHQVFDGKQLLISELNTAFEGRVRWLAELRTWLETEAPWVTGVVLSQGESVGQIQLGPQVGDLSWNVDSDPETQPVVRGMIADLSPP